MASATYRGAIIGLGYIGGADQVSGDALGQRVVDLDGTHLYAMQNHSRVELVSGSSRDNGRRARFIEKTSARTYPDWREMLEKEQLDIVSVATYTPQHAEIAMACAEKGIRVVFCEKPIASTPAQADRMLAACQKSGSLLAVNHNRRFHANCRRLRDLCLAGELGDLTSVSIQWGSGRLGNVGTHMFNCACMLTGRHVEAVLATLDLSHRPDCRGGEFTDPGGWGLLRLEDGLMATFDGGDFGQIPGTITLNGSKGRAVGGGDDVTLEFWNGKKDYWPAPDDSKSSMDQAMEEIVAWLDGDQPFPDSPEDSLHTLEVIAACHASHQRNSAWMPLPLAGADRKIDIGSG